MPNKLSSVKEADIIHALEHIDQKGVPKDNEWNQYWIMYNRRPYPFKHSVTLASDFKIDYYQKIDIKTSNIIRSNHWTRTEANNNDRCSLITEIKSNTHIFCYISNGLKQWFQI